VISYDSPPARQRRPPRRRSPRWPLVVACVVVAVGLLAGYKFLSRPAPRPAPPAARGPLLSHAQALKLGACIDPTLSIESSFAPSIRHDLATGIGQLAPPAGPPRTDRRTRAQPAVSLLIREVDTNSFSSQPGQYAAQVTVSGVHGLTRRRPPPSASAGYTRALAIWSKDSQVVAADRKQAAGDAASAVRTVAALPLDRRKGSFSAITACVSALLVDVPAGGRRGYLVASDLEENEAPQLAGSFGGAPLLIVQTCESGDAGRCQQLLSHFKALMHRLHAGRITVVRPEDAGPAIAQGVRTGEVSP